MTNKIKIVKKSNIIAVPVRTIGDEEGSHPFSFAVLKLDEPTIKIIKRAILNRKLAGNDMKLYSLVYQNPIEKNFRFVDNTDLEKKLKERLSDKHEYCEGYSFISDFPKEEEDSERPECVRMNVLDTGIIFSAYIANTNTEIETAEIPFEIF